MDCKIRDWTFIPSGEIREFRLLAHTRYILINRIFSTRTGWEGEPGKQPALPTPIYETLRNPPPPSIHQHTFRLKYLAPWHTVQLGTEIDNDMRAGFERAFLDRAVPGQNGVINQVQ